MTIIPAIDLIEGKCVRLEGGDFNKKSIYSEDPIDMAFQFKDMGAKRLHIVDLDGAKDGQSYQNRNIIKEIKKKTNLVIETGGGIRTEDDVKDLLFEGIDYIILGTILVKKIETVQKWIDDFGNYFIASVDTKNRKVQTHGWLKGEEIDMMEFGKKLFKVGFKIATYTDVTRDGMLQGPNIEEARDFTSQTGLRIILAGGITSEDDIKQAKTLSYYGLDGIIIGKALYENRLDLAKMIKLYQT